MLCWTGDKISGCGWDGVAEWKRVEDSVAPDCDYRISASSPSCLIYSYLSLLLLSS